MGNIRINDPVLRDEYAVKWGELKGLASSKGGGFEKIFNIERAFRDLFDIRIKDLEMRIAKLEEES